MKINVTVAYSPVPRTVQEWALVMEEGATVLHALQASGLAQSCPGMDLRSAVAGVWGRRARLNQPLRERDRVEIYRPLKVDPKVARRERFRAQGVRGTGLFAKKRAGAKAGY